MAVTNLQYSQIVCSKENTEDSKFSLKFIKLLLFLCRLCEENLITFKDVEIQKAIGMFQF